MASKNSQKPRPHFEGLWMQKRANGKGVRYLLKRKTDEGTYVFVTVPVEDSDTDIEFLDKCREAEKKLEAKIHPPKDLKFYLEQYIRLRRLSQSSQYQYHHYLEGFSLDDENNSRKVSELMKHPHGNNTMRQVLGIINTFFKYVIGCGVAVKNPVAGVRPAKLTHRTRVPTEDEIKIVLEWAKNDPQDELYVRILISTGARCSSVDNLRVGDLRDDHISFKNEKGDKRYDYPILLEDSRAIQLWREQSNGKADIDLLFDDGVRTSRRIKWFMYKKIPPDMNGERLSPHSFRHGFASRLVQAGVDIATVARLLDHSTPTVTYMYYARHSQEQLDEAIRRGDKELWPTPLPDKPANKKRKKAVSQDSLDEAVRKLN